MYLIRIYSLLLLFLSCDNPLTQEDNLHCIIDYNGFYDDCGICSAGLSGHIANSELDCNEVCGGNAIIDGCGICDGNNSSCDTENCEDLDIDNVCDSGDDCIGLYDECGVCNGENFSKDLCGICYGDNNSCNIGLITLATWQFQELHFWNNDNCIGTPYNSFYNHVCLEDFCYDYNIDFYFNTSNGSLSFTQINQKWGINGSNSFEENIYQLT